MPQTRQIEFQKKKSIPKQPFITIVRLYKKSYYEKNNNNTIASI